MPEPPARRAVEYHNLLNTDKDRTRPEEGKLKVLHLLKTSVGAAWAVRQVRELVKLGVDVHVALPSGGGRVAEYEAVGARVHLATLDFPVSQPWRLRTVLGEVQDLVAETKPDIIHSHFVGTTLTMRLGLGKRHSVPRVFQVPGPLHLEHPLFRWAEINTAGPTDSWIGSCQWTVERYMKSGIPSDRVFLSFYGSDLDKFADLPKGKLRRELGIGPHTKVVGLVAYMYAPKVYLGQRRGLKGHEDLIDALAICMREDADLIGVFIGGAWNNAVSYEHRVKKYAQKQCGNRIVFLGSRNDVPDLYADLDLSVHPSRSENLGGAAESLLCGVPTIATNVGGFPDIVKDGITGWLIPPGDPPSLAARILQVLRDPVGSKVVAQRGRELALSELDVRKTARQVFDIYAAILARGACPFSGSSAADK